MGGPNGMEQDCRCWSFGDFAENLLDTTEWRGEKTDLKSPIVGECVGEWAELIGVSDAKCRKQMMLLTGEPIDLWCGPCMGEESQNLGVVSKFVRIVDSGERIRGVVVRCGYVCRREA